MSKNTLLFACGAEVILILMAAPTVAKCQLANSRPDLTELQTYIAGRSSSADPLGANKDFRRVESGKTYTVLDVDGPGSVTHIWFAIADNEPMALKRVVIRMYWDQERTPSVEAPVGDFFGLGLGKCVPWQSEVLAVAPNCGLNSFFNMPYARHARITITNEGHEAMWGLFYNVDYRTYRNQLRPKTLYFHAQYRQAQPNLGVASNWRNNQDPIADARSNLYGKDNYVWLATKGSGQYVGVTMSVLQNQDYWWGEGDEMFFVDDDIRPTIQGTGAEDYFTGTGDFGGSPFSYALSGASVVGKERAGSESSMYRFHLESPIPFARRFEATLEHGSGNVRSDNFYSVAYWYQAEPHAAFPVLPPPDDRIPRRVAVEGPGGAIPPQ